MADSRDTIGQHQSSHEDLIEMVSPRSRLTSRDARLDAIIVPAGREAKNLTTAISLAKEADCHLVVLCSKDAKPYEVRPLFRGKDFTKGTAITVPGHYGIPDLRLETNEWMQSSGKIVGAERKSDLSVKRNMGLLIARMLGWQHIFFLDDDIRGISVRDLNRTVGLLGTGGNGYRSAGLQVERLDRSTGQEEHVSARVEISHTSDTQEQKFQLSIEVKKFRSSSMQVKHFPDNSVVCHARRMVDEEQNVFVSGSVLAVDCTAPFDFFPDIYNEDWLFFYQDVANHKLASPGLQATQKMAQMKYNPFADPQRAKREEFGDVIAEGIYSLLHHDLDLKSADRQYWKTFLDNRKTILDKIIEQLYKAPLQRREEIKKATLGARDTLNQITPDMCVEYLAAWQRDLDRWKGLLMNLPRKDSVEDALRHLNLPL